MNYKTYKTTFGQEYVMVDYPDGSRMCIPNDPANTDYQQFLRWCEAGNTPSLPDEQNAE